MQQNADPGAQVAAQFGLHRSPEWPKAEKDHLQLEPTCVACGGTENLQVHHIIPFHFCILLGRPDLELDHRNLATLCEREQTNHHLLLGHLDSFKSSNPNVRADTKRYLGWLAARIVDDPHWKQRVGTRTPEWAV